MGSMGWYGVVSTVVVFCFVVGTLMALSYAKNLRSIIRIMLILWLSIAAIIILAVLDLPYISIKEKSLCVLMIIAGSIVILFIVTFFVRKMFQKRGITKFDSSADI